MRILIVSGDFYPNNSPRSFRTTELVKEMSKLGHDVTLYIPNFGIDYSEFTEKYPVKIRYFERTIEKRKYLGISLIDKVIFYIRNQIHC